jgi:hypothetical protein
MYKPADPPEAPADLAFFSSHALRFGPATFMIVTAQMQHSVNQEGHELFFQRPPRHLGLALSGRKGNNHVTELCAGPTEAVGRSSLPERKGQNVRTAVLVPEPVVELPHPAIADERDTQVCRRLPDEREHRLGQPQDLPATQPYRSYLYLKANGH